MGDNPKYGHCRHGVWFNTPCPVCGDTSSFAATTGSGSWLERMDRDLGTVVTPFLVGVAVGIVFTVVVFLVCFLITGGT